MPPFCSRHSMYHDHYNEYYTMTRRAEVQAAKGARKAEAGRVAETFVNGLVGSNAIVTVQRGMLVETMTNAVLAGMRVE